MTLIKFGTESMQMEMLKEPNLEEICIAKYRDQQICRFCEKVHVFLFIFNYI